MFGKNDVFSTPKPERLLKRILEIATNPNDLIRIGKSWKMILAWIACGYLTWAK